MVLPSTYIRESAVKSMLRRVCGSKLPRKRAQASLRTPKLVASFFSGENLGQLAVGRREALQPRAHNIVGKGEVKISRSPRGSRVEAGFQPFGMSGENDRQAVVLVVIRLGMLVNQKRGAAIEQRPVSFRNRF